MLPLFYASTFFAQNTLPPTGNVGIGTMNPTNQLEVVGKTKLGKVNITDTLTVYRPVNMKDSVTVDKKLTVKQDVKIVGKTVMTGNVRAKSNLTVIGNTRTKGNEVVEGNTKILGVTKMKGNAFVEGTFKFKGLADSSTTDNRFLMIRPNGKAESLNKEGLLTGIYINDCKGTGSSDPVWASRPGILWTGDCTPAKVGVGTRNPLAALHVTGSSLISGTVSIGNLAQANPARLRIYTQGTGQTAMHIDAPNAGSYQYVQRISVPDGTAKAIAVHNNSFGDSFQVLANGRVTSYVTDPSYAMVLYKHDNNSSTTNEKIFEVLTTGHVYAREITVTLDAFPDYVFNKEYELLDLKELAKYIENKGHLPNVPSAEEVDKNGIGVGELQVKLLEKVEELTLYILQLEERINELENK